MEINTVVNSAKNIPTNYSLEQNYPNPFNPTTVIAYQLPIAGQVSLMIYNNLGQKIGTLVNETQESGYHSRTWNSTNDDGLSIPSGLYYYRLNVFNDDKQITYSQVRKMILLK